MKKNPKILIGILIGGLVGLLVWYWQKSTSAEEGALDLLDRLADVEARLREVQGRLQRHAPGLDITNQPQPQAAPGPSMADDLTLLDGIGPTYAQRLNAAGIQTFADLAAQDPDRVREIAQIKAWHVHDPAAWIAEARQRSQAA